MAVAINIGGVLVDVNELNERRNGIDDLVRDVRGEERPGPRAGGPRARGGLEFSSGSVDFESLLDELRTQPAVTVAGTIPKGPPIELGRPLHIEVITAFSGQVGRRRETDLLIASAVKNTASHDAMPKAVNQIFQGAVRSAVTSPGDEMKTHIDRTAIWPTH